MNFIPFSSFLFLVLHPDTLFLPPYLQFFFFYHGLLSPRTTDTIQLPALPLRRTFGCICLSGRIHLAQFHPRIQYPL